MATENTKQVNLTASEIETIRSALNLAYKSALRAANNADMTELKSIFEKKASQINNLINKMVP